MTAAEVRKAAGGSRMSCSPKYHGVVALHRMERSLRTFTTKKNNPRDWNLPNVSCFSVAQAPNYAPMRTREEPVPLFLNSPAQELQQRETNISFVLAGQRH